MANHTLLCTKCGRLFSEYGKSTGLSAGKAVVGGILAGPVGAIAGASMGKKQRQTSCPYCGSYQFRRC